MTPAFACALLIGSALLSGGASLLLRSPRHSRIAGFGGGAAASLLGLFLAFGIFAGKATVRIPLPAPVPWVDAELFIDGLSAFFLMVVFLLGFLASIYAIGYMREFDGRRRGRGAPLFFNLLLLSMALVVSAGDMLTFLIAWEGMSLASYFLVVVEHDRPESRRAGLIYLIATHIGTGGIFVSFLFLMNASGSFSFDGFARIPATGPMGLAAAFWFALLGFGTKAGMFPFHIWLPYAHPEAPSPVSALMSGVMIKMGVYGIVRYLFYLLPAPSPSFGAVVVFFGLLSGVFGVLYAIAQHDLKRLLAFHSVENIGIILLGVGAASLCLSAGHPDPARLLLAGGLFHVLNHALFKGLLFMGAGAVYQGTRTKNIERMGGLMRGMPATGVTFLLGSLAISAVPPLNGFASEFAIYRGLWDAAGRWGVQPGLLIAAMAGLALVGGLAFVCFVKVVGTVFLGKARSPVAAEARDPVWTMTVPMGALAALCLIAGILPQAALGPLLDRVPFPAQPIPPFTGVGKPWVVAAAIAAAVGALVLLRVALLRKNGVREHGTWACGFSYFTPRMQYTATSFADPVIHIFRGILRPRSVREERRSGRFLQEVQFETHVRDLLENGLYLPVYRLFVRLAFLARRLHTGHIHLYLAYVLGTVVVLLVFFR